MRALSVLLFLAWSLLAPALAQDLTLEKFNAEIDAITAARSDNKITRLQWAIGTSDIIKKYMPTDYAAHTLADSRVFLSTRLEQKKIDRAEYDYLWSEKHNEFKVKNLEIEARQQAAYAAQQERERHAAHQQQMQNQANNAAANAMLLQGIGNAFTRTYQPSGTNCVTVPVGASLSTSCY